MTPETKYLRCDSGIHGSERPLIREYRDFEDFQGYCEVYGIHERLGFESPEEAWKYNPIIQSSTVPSDLRISSIQIEGETYTVEPHFDDDSVLDYWEIYDSKGFCIHDGEQFYDNAPTFADIMERLDMQR